MKTSGNNIKLDTLRNLNFERELISHLLKRKSNFEQALSLEAKDFHYDGYSKAFEKMKELFYNGGKWSGAIIAQHMSLNSEIYTNNDEAVHELYTLKEKSYSLPTPIPALCEEIKKLSIRRDLNTLILQAQTLIADPFKDPSEVISVLHGYTPDTAVESSKTLAESLKDLLTAKEPVRKIMTGFPELDFLLRGFKPGKLILPMARPAMGKTAFALEIARSSASKGLYTSVISLEMPYDELTVRLLSQETQIPSHDIEDRLESKALTEADQESIRSLGKVKDYIDLACENIGFLHQIIDYAKRKKAEGKLDLLIIDYLQLIRIASSHYKSRIDIVTDISQSLKRLAMELNIPILALCQLSRAVETRTNQEPVLSDLRDSGSLEQDADQVFSIYRADQRGKGEFADGTGAKGRALVEVLKNRSGRLGKVYFQFKGETLSFLNETINDLIPPSLHTSLRELEEDEYDNLPWDGHDTQLLN